VLLRKRDALSVHKVVVFRGPTKCRSRCHRRRLVGNAVSGMDMGVALSADWAWWWPGLAALLAERRCCHCGRAGYAGRGYGNDGACLS
jgi:hypothetical protein